MTAQMMDGTRVAAELYAATTKRTAEFTSEYGRRPCLAAVLVGEDPASRTYVRMKKNRCAKVGIESVGVELPEATTTEELVAKITALSADPAIDGILLQHPVPAQIDERAAFEAIIASKDVDGVTLTSFGRMAMGEPGFASCTPEGIIRLLDAYDVEISGKHAVVAGRSAILGKPVGMLLLARNATVTYCHSRTRDLASYIAQGDIVVAAVGRPELIRGEWIKPGAVVIDAGYSSGSVGDVELAAATERASLITPVPGGVGPMTIALLLEQTVDAAYALQRARDKAASV